MRIVHLTSLLSSNGGGIPPAVMSLATAQQRQGDDIRLLGLSDPSAPIIAHDPSLTLSAFRAIGSVQQGPAPAMTTELIRLKPSLIHLHGLFTFPSHLTRFAAIARVPTVISPHGMLAASALERSAWKKKLAFVGYERDNLRRARCLHALHGQEARDIRAFGLTQPLAIVPNGVEPLVPASREELATVDRKLGSDDRKILLFLGRLDPIKGLIPLVEAWSRSRSRLTKWRLVLVGPDWRGHQAAVEERVRQLELTDDVTFFGPAFGGEKTAVLQRAAAFVLPSLTEASSVALLEALSAGLPVVVTPGANFSNAEVDRVGLVADEARGGLEGALSRLTAMPDAELRDAGNAAKKLVTERYSWSSIAEQLLSVYRWLLEGGEPPRCVESVAE